MRQGERLTSTVQLVPFTTYCYRKLGSLSHDYLEDGDRVMFIRYDTQGIEVVWLYGVTPGRCLEKAGPFYLLNAECLEKV
jgi:hypothetical protein